MRARGWRGSPGRRLLILVSATVVVAIVVLPSVPLSGHGFEAGKSDAASAGVQSFANATTSNATSWDGTASSTSAGLTPSLPSPPPVPGVATYSNWPTYEQNQQRTGKNAYENTISASNASQLSQIWVNTTTAGVYGSPAVVNGTVYIGDYSGNESAFSGSSGHRLWFAHMAGSSGNYSWTGCFGNLPYAWNASGAENNVRGITASATVWNNLVFVPADNNHLYALYANNGTVRHGWPVDLSNNTSDPYYRAFYPWSSPLVYNGYVYVGTASGCDSPLIQGGLLQINITAHPAVVNRLNLTPVAKGGGGIWSTPSVDSVANTIWVTTGNTGISGPPNGYNWSQAIVGINGTNVCQPQGSTCSVKGYYHLNSGSGADIDFGAGATVYRLANGTAMVVATNKNGVAYAFYATTLKATGSSIPAWTLRTSNTPPNSGGWNIAPAAFDGSTLYFGGSATVLTTHGNQACPQGSVRAVYPNGTIKWESCAPGDVRAGLTVANGVVVDAADWKNNYYGTVEVRSAATGTVLKNITVSQGVNGEPVISDGRLYFGTGNWTLCGNTSADPHCPIGHVYAYGIPLKDVPATPILLPSSQCISSFPVQYSSAATGGMPGYAFNWTFGDGTWAIGTAPLHQFVFGGNYTASVVAEDSAAELNYSSFNVNVTFQAPQSRIIVGCSSTTAVCPQTQCTGPGPLLRSFFVDYSHNVGPVTISWNFGDGHTSSSQDPTHTYSEHGLYTAKLTITDSNGNQGIWILKVWA